jgi:hypothetical protein
MRVAEEGERIIYRIAEGRNAADAVSGVSSWAVPPSPARRTLAMWSIATM